MNFVLIYCFFLFLILSYFINIANELSPLFRFQKLYKAEFIIESLVNSDDDEEEEEKKESFL